MEAPVAITLECGQTVKLIAQNVEGKVDVAFAKPGSAPPALLQAAAEAKAKTDAETEAKKNAEANITTQQNEINCVPEHCNKVAPPPTSRVTTAGTATSTLNPDRSGTAHGTAKAEGKGTIKCQPAA